MSIGRIVLVGAAIFLTMIAAVLISQYRTVPITYNLEDGEFITYTLRGWGSVLDVRLSSTNGEMYVKIVVDGQVVYEHEGYQASYRSNIGFGVHVIHIHIQNPTVLGLGKAIVVSGKVSLTFW